MKTDNDKTKKITYFSRDPVVCPVCGTRFHREEMYTGGGRLMAGKLTEDLRRLYEPSRKYGVLYPLIYYITVCPLCHYATFPEDFTGISGQVKKAIEDESGKRKEGLAGLFPNLNFSAQRDLEEGVASYFLAVMCYDHFEKRYSPTLKRALCSLRAGWLCGDLHRRSPGENYDYLSELFFRKARFFYSMAVEREQTGKELLSGIKSFGPDLDKNYGYEGLLYVAAFLEYRYGQKGNPEVRLKSLENLKRVISKTHGIGKASKAKPSSILEKAKELYEKVGAEIQRLKSELQP